MPRPRIGVGELGVVNVTRLPNGSYRARGNTRDGGGIPVRLAVTAATEEAAREDLRRRAMAVGSGVAVALTKQSTFAEAVDLWLEQIRSRAKTGSLSYSTFESYETTARLVLLPLCGGLRLEQFTVGRCDRVIQRILEEHSISKARRAR